MVESFLKVLAWAEIPRTKRSREIVKYRFIKGFNSIVEDSRFLVLNKNSAKYKIAQ